ncbi:helix-turn-helix domain-containing protein [Alkalibaculum sp. M08DMB]|uniref:Helix-turn-helix domain-containing protein n=1 Tax=Alkalibaculum sporogenes TaxID=2655001 RepID=A0A6A7KAN4_9FIRM|nr:helix-turn-helix transcriptional regulator [Alkalibaculum sporogenes]MPW26432.1 helix-turn-helix domain-containing protein [Alkalibaculum sporogenes]
MLGNILKELRGERSQEEISEQLGISRARYSHYETDRREPDIETLKLLSDFYKVSIDYLLGKTKDPIPYHIISEDIELTPKERLKELFQHPKIRDKELAFKDFDSMDDEDIESIIEYVEARYLLAEKRKNDNRE